MMPVLQTVLVAAQLVSGSADPSAAAARPAPVEIVVFSDFQCPFCARFARPLRELQAAGADGVPVTVTFKNFPLPMHARAPLAHQAAVDAGGQGRFWEMHDLLFANQQRADRDDLISYARRLGLDVERFRADMDSDRIKHAIEADKMDGQQLRVGGTPTYYVNGREYSGATTIDDLKRIVAAGRIGLDEVVFARALQEHRYAARVDADLQTGRKKGIRGSPAIVINGRRIDGVPTTQALADYIESALSTPPQTDQRRKQ